jgi:hypothetical protein
LTIRQKTTNFDLQPLAVDTLLGCFLPRLLGRAKARFFLLSAKE